MIRAKEWRLRTLVMVLLAVTTAATLATLTAVGGGLMLWHQPQIRQDNLVQVRREAQQLAERMEILLGGLQRQMELAGVLLARMPKDMLGGFLEELTGEGQPFDAIYLAGPDGTVEAVSLRLEASMHRGELLGSDLSANRLYRAAVQRKTPVWSNKFLSALSGDVAVGIAVPVGNRVLIGELSLTELLRTLQVATRDPQLLVWVIDRRGELVAEAGSENKLGLVNLLGLPVVQAALAGNPLPDSVTLRGENFYPAVAQSSMLDWFFLVRMPAGLNNPDVRSTALLVVVALSSSLLIGTLVAPLFAGWMSRPIRAITSRARQIADGKPSAGWPRGPIAELNALAVDLETMAKHLQERQDQFHAIFNASPVPMAVVDSEVGGVLIDVNEAWVLQFGRSREMTIGRSAQELRLWANESEFTEITRMGQLGHDRIEAWLLDADERRLLCEFSSRPVVIEGSTLAIWVIRDVTNRKRTEELIRANNLMLEGVTRAQREFILETDPRRGFDRILALLLETTASEYGFIGEVFLQPGGQPYLKTHAMSNIAWNEETTDWFEKNAPAGLEFRNLNTLFGAVMTTRETVIANDPAHDPRRGGLPVGHPPLRGFLGIPFFHGEKMIGMVGLANRVGGYDESVIQKLAPILATCSSLVLAYSLVRERKLGEDKLRNALAEKEVLLKEIYHRVKNNLQVVASLLNLQSRRAADAGVRQLLDDSANRVKSMALVHEQLYRAGNLSSIKLPEYLKQLTDNLSIVNRPLSTRVPLMLEVDPLTLGVESAIPLGLVVNELVSNAYRHAYAADAPGGKIVVRLIGSQEGQVCLEVRDDGRGLPEGFELDKGACLGMRLVETLAQQLGAMLTWDTNHQGTCFMVQFAVQTRAAQPAQSVTA